MRITKVTQKDLVWIQKVFQQEWGDVFVVSGEKIYYPKNLEGFILLEKNEKLGLITFHSNNNEIEIVTLNSFQENLGIGTSLVKSVIEEAKMRKKKRIWLITTNDNIEALKFYQKRGFSLVAIHRGAIDASRKIKPSIPRIGKHAIPISDELELELMLN